jgi:hypothetical protein
MNQFIFYTPSVFKSLVHLPDVKLWLQTLRVSGDNIGSIDRTGTTINPIRTTTLDINKLPKFDPTFSMSFDECAINRAKEIYNQHQIKNVPIRLSWSGGIDSSTALLSFIELLGVKEASNCIEVVMTHASIMENPYIWEKIVRKENFKIVNASHFNESWNGGAIIVNGEGGDQVHGGDMPKHLFTLFGSDGLKMPMNEDNVYRFVKFRSNSPLIIAPGINHDDAIKVTDVLCRQFRNAPIPLETMNDALSMLNFSSKWASTFYRLITKANRPLSEEFIKNYYFPFYGSLDFQQWAMHPNGEKTKGTNESYKWKAKEYICRVSNTPELQMKHRFSSLVGIFNHVKRADFIDKELNFYKEINPEEWYNPENTFKLF